ncbi:MAG TPA: outer membrane beta-barrel family protein, partial [Bacteroidia bacterium]|nr:outer membrane beta-barrel family protein [Bacteroidia bacterium]
INFAFNDIQQFANNYPTSENQYFQPPLLYGHVPFYNQTYIFQTDYVTPLENKAKFETGVKTSYVNIDANTQFFLGPDNSSSVDSAQTEHFKYKENIIAGYCTYSRSFGRSNFSIGLRGEQTIATGNLVTTAQTINRNYLYWFPHITYTDTLNQLNNLEVSTGTRFNRPGYDELNPFKNYINPTTYNQGNPNLVPEYEYDINVSDVFKSIYVFTLSYAGTKHPEEQVHIPAPAEPGVTLITNENLQWKNYYGFNISAIPQIKKWWTGNNYVALYYNQYIADVSQTPINTGKLIFQGNSDNNFSLGNKTSLEINGQYSSGGFWGYFQSSPRWSIGSGIQCKCLRDKCTIKLSITDIFYTNYFNTTSSVYNYNENYIVKRDTRVYGISITYRFGKNSLPEDNKVKKIDNTQDNSGKIY